MEQLPDDLLADVLCRLPPSSLAASRCVRKDWCAIIDGRRLLRADLLPLRLDGIYCISLNTIDRGTYLFARPSAALGRRVPGGCLDFLQYYTELRVDDHCNGLLLVDDYMVVNPATRQWADLPTSPAEHPSIDDMLGGVRFWRDQEQEKDKLMGSYFYLVYDPMAESAQHFEVFAIPFLHHSLLRRNRENITINLEDQEWPPSTFRTHVFSSRRWRWEERSLLRQRGDREPAARTMADMLQYDGSWEHKAVYFRGALYVQCQDDSVMRIDVSNDKYQMIRFPATRSEFGAHNATFYLEKSEKGVYFALLYKVDWDSYRRFQVWLLKEEVNDSHHTVDMEWVLKTDISLEPLLKLARPRLHSIADDEWRIIRNYNDNKDIPPATGQFAADDDEWDFDNGHEIVLQANKDNKTKAHTFLMDFLGFHPYKEIVFFSFSTRTISYNFSTSKVQDLGATALIPVDIRTCFPYAPCLLPMGECFESS